MSKDEVRDRIQALYTKCLDGDERLAAGLERCTYNVVAETAKSACVPRFWENKQFKKMYTTKARSLMFNLNNPATPHLKRDLMTRYDLTCLREFVRMTPQQMYPELWAPAYKELRKKAMRGKPEEIDKNHVGLYRCSRCKSMRTDYKLIQTRSADEPSSAFVLCGDCGKRWKMSA